MEALGETDRTKEERRISREKKDAEKREIVRDGREEIKRERETNGEFRNREERKSLIEKGKHETAEQAS